LESADFINKCLQRKPGARLGLNGANELKQHVWLRDYDFVGLEEKKIPSPFNPKVNLANGPKRVINFKKLAKAREEKNYIKNPKMKKMQHLKTHVEID
jgi:hypothetical protein